ncbi:TD and POZ domain-containing protein 1 [Araneus ventricosus]|uniref:TD and POZ domain-containing protein 1 n=1 Tax=Araneus ventricosus TaxID=182803 RepID=A0A4Y2KG94_ARAVE|nr:TD and POZ domain-containing protein 1 [Araneus ventricosus]
MADETKRAFEVKWRIEQIKSWLQTRHDSIYSPPFLAETLMNTRWKLRMSPNWQLAEKYVSLSLQRDVEDDHLELIDLSYELSFLAGDGTPLKSKRCMKNFAPKTVSHKLNVKQNVIIDEKNGAYLSEGVLTVCCKLWKKSTVSKEGQCSLRSVIGTQQITLKETIYHFNPPSVVPVNFMPPSTDISLICLDVYASENEFIFERKHIECKSISWYSCKLFALNGKGYKTEFDEKINITEESLPSKNAEKLQSIDYSDFLFRYFSCGGLTLQLEITYYPGITMEGLESEFNSLGRLPCRDTDLENLNVHDSERVHTNTTDCLHPLETSDDEEGESNDEDESSEEDECFSITGKRNLLSTTLQEDLTSLYKDRLFCDTKLQTDTETFPAHRSILSARSPVFKKMFTADMKEKAGECINVPDIGSDTMRQMLQFIYTDFTGDLEMQSAKDLYVASDKYDITSLKNCCSSFMKKNLCISNVCEVLVLADIHQDKDLEYAAQEFVLTYYKEVLGSDEWKLFMKNFSSLAAQIMYLKCMKE